MNPNKTLQRPALLLAALAALASGPAMAQMPKTRPDPADARAAVAPLTYESSLARYRKADAEAPPLAWREANDAVERIGGWRAYAREAAATPAAPASAPASAPPGPRR